MDDREAVPGWFEPRLPTAEECSIGHALAARARQAPDQVFAFFDGGRRLTHAEMFDASRTLAGRLCGLGVKPGDRVAIWQPNGPDILASIFACSMLGASACLINIAFRGAMLAHALRIADTEILVAHGGLVDRLGGIDTGALRCVLATGTFDEPPRGLDVRLASEFPIVKAVPPRLNDPWDIAAIIFTSGTTGPSKGVRVTCCQLWSLGRAFYGFMTPADRMLAMLPLFHVASLGAFWGTMSAGASLTVMESFRTADFWDVVRGTGVTTNCGFAGAFMALLLKAPPRDDDQDHGMRQMLVTSVNPSVRRFAERFGCRVFAGYSMSETSGITLSQVDPAKDRTIGRPRKGIQVRLVDSHDIETVLGQPGEMIVRADVPWSLNAGYQGNPQATADAWRNGWFHTGDLHVQDQDGDYFYLDRLKDAIRRRGENISSFELEAEIRTFPSVGDVAAIGVDTPGGEEVLAVVSPAAGRTIDPRALIEFLIPRLPHFMVPRFVRIVEDLPRTETNKVMKPKLREEGCTPDCWDREAAGIVLRRVRLQG